MGSDFYMNPPRDGDKKDDGLDLDLDRLTVASKNEATVLYEDRTFKYVLDLNEKIQSRISTEWSPGSTMIIPIAGEMEIAAAKMLTAKYETQEWSFTVGQDYNKNWKITIK